VRLLRADRHHPDAETGRPRGREAREATLASLGESLGRSCEVELLIPGTRASERVSVSIQDATLHYVVENVGLVVGGPRTPQTD
jgi:hypothetical protein